MEFNKILLEIYNKEAQSVLKFNSLINILDKRYKKIESKKHAALDIIQSALSSFNCGSGRTVHQKGNDITKLVSAVSLYYNDKDMKKIAEEEYNKTIKEITQKCLRKI
ncbi:MAG: hypothetical protein ACOC3V_05690 [bacterium]